MFCSICKVVGHSIDSCTNTNKEPLNNALETKKKPTQIYVQVHKDNSKVAQHLVPEPTIIVDNHLFEVKSGKRPLVENGVLEQNQLSRIDQQGVFHDGTSGVEKSPPLSNKFTTLLDVTQESMESDDSSLDKEFIDEMQVIEDDIYTIENSLASNLKNHNFMHNSWDALAKNNIGDHINAANLKDSSLKPPDFTLIKSKNKKKKVKLASGYITRSKVDHTITFK